ncbi:hypothetical protein DMH04_04180 [Kibdelosporangium aridum]|uniref:Uncharacterized protein n=1 Tax=Kibdelosporangium aridum TaxID=2030 RepID=A0A428ZRI6_KIBAR|nr:hypothetical protein DMH04_04180 [Kibdelosporangium aridum]
MLNTIRQIAEERRNRTQPPAARLGEQRGKCVGVYEVSGLRKVARVLLASGFVVTAYLGASAAIPEVGSDVVVAGAQGGDCPAGTCKVQSPDQPTTRYQIPE